VGAFFFFFLFRFSVFLRSFLLLHRFDQGRKHRNTRGATKQVHQPKKRTSQSRKKEEAATMSTKKASKPKHHGINKSKASTNPFRVVPKGIKHFRDKATIMRLNMYSKGKSDFRSRDLPNARIEPNRRWFGVYPSSSSSIFHLPSSITKTKRS
jgi:hypothetical protein